MSTGDIFISKKKSSKTAEFWKNACCMLTLIGFAAIMREILAPESHFPLLVPCVLLSSENTGKWEQVLIINQEAISTSQKQCYQGRAECEKPRWIRSYATTINQKIYMY